MNKAIFNNCSDSGESLNCSNSEWGITVNPLKIVKKLTAIFNHGIYFGLCVPVFGRDGCMHTDGFRYTKCIDLKFAREFLLGG